MNKTFEQEWNLYKEGGKRPSFAGEAPRGDAEFDSAGSVRHSRARRRAATRNSIRRSMLAK